MSVLRHGALKNPHFEKDMGFDSGGMDLFLIFNHRFPPEIWRDNMALTSIPGISLAILIYTYREFERSHRIYGVIIEQCYPCISPVLKKTWSVILVEWNCYSFSTIGFPPEFWIVNKFLTSISGILWAILLYTHRKFEGSHRIFMVWTSLPCVSMRDKCIAVLLCLPKRRDVAACFSTWHGFVSSFCIQVWNTLLQLDRWSFWCHTNFL